jgi:hypothetical protein
LSQVRRTLEEKVQQYGLEMEKLKAEAHECVQLRQEVAVFFIFPPCFTIQCFALLGGVFEDVSLDCILGTRVRAAAAGGRLLCRNLLRNGVCENYFTRLHTWRMSACKLRRGWR